MFSHAAFAGMFLAGDRRSLRPRPPALPRKIEFYGDSITVGAVNEVYPYDDDCSQMN